MIGSTGYHQDGKSDRRDDWRCVEDSGIDFEGDSVYDWEAYLADEH